MTVTFQKAAPKQARLKVGLYGPPGSGKTFTALLVAEGLAKIDGKRIAYVDTERGTDFYSQAVPQRAVHPEAFDFDAIYTTSLVDVIDAINALDAKAYGVVVLDSVSHLWDSAIAAYSGKKVGEEKDKIPMPAWGSIKRPFKGLIRTLLDSPFHVFILGRQKNEFEKQGDELVKVGVAMRAEGETAYEPHICIRMEAKRGERDVFANVEKDRTGILSGKVIPNPSFLTFQPLLALLGNEQAQSDDPDETAAKDSDLLRRDDEKSKGKEEKSAELMTKFNADIAAASTLEMLSKVAAGMKKEKRHLMEPHEDSLKIVYGQKHKTLAAALAPTEA
jgi:hypothetical protein